MATIDLVCRRCGLEKPHYPSNKYRCKDCASETPSQSKEKNAERGRAYRDKVSIEKRREYHKEWSARNADKVRAYRKANRERDRKSLRVWTLKNRYGLTPEEFDALLQAQGNACAICKVEASGVRAWHVDHCHTTEKVRGILCTKCNPMLGFARDDVEILKSAIRYLEA